MLIGHTAWEADSTNGWRRGLAHEAVVSHIGRWAKKCVAAWIRMHARWDLCHCNMASLSVSSLSRFFGNIDYHTTYYYLQLTNGRILHIRRLNFSFDLGY